ncbi:MAG TPA: carboxypeptidase M32 [Phototrophicaceae bacterium]|jgi:carboxypeptidase Taq|nr:carboxypeptidase M32 [Phototrophicaceae bacterium]
MTKYQELVSHFADIVHLGRAGDLLDWDAQVNLPAAGAAARGAQLAVISRLRHELLTSDTTAKLLEEAEAETRSLTYDSNEASLVRVARYDYEEATKVPAKFVGEMSELTTTSHEIWAKARSENNFRGFQSALEKMMDMARQLADYRGYTEHPYDALLNHYERGMTTERVKAIFDGHKPQLVELIAAINKNGRKTSNAILHQPLDVSKQGEFARWAASTIGFDFKRGRQDVAVHPFAMGIARTDVRLTTRFYPEFLNPALFGMMHEAGHGMYEQGSAEELEGTPLSGGTSLAVHESQSRLWENIIGRSLGFWQYALPKLRETFPGQFDNISLEDFHRAINQVQPSYIRVEADEATYNLHIMLRFELETGLLKGDIKVADLPEEWNDRFESYLGITPTSDREGVLQDVHWSAGLIGYFPTYALGNLLSVQYYNQALKDHPSIPDEIAQGNSSTLLTWLNDKIYRHGRKFTSVELTERITGTSINAAPYIEYLKQKYSTVYGL